MPTRDQLATALRKADAAGASQDAKRLADAIRAMDAQGASGYGADPMGGAKGEWDLSKFEALPRQQQAPPAVNAPNPITTAVRQSQVQAGNQWQQNKLAEEAARKERAIYSAASGMPFTGGEDGSIPQLNTNPGPVFTDIGKGIATTPQHIERGVVSGVESMINLPSDVADFLNSANKGTAAEQKPVPRADFSGAKVGIPEGYDSVSGNLAEGLAQFLVARKLVGSAAPGGGLAPQLGKDALATGLGFDGSTGRVADMIDPNAIPEGPLRDYAIYLRSQPEDSPLVGRFKNLLEDMTVSGPMVAPQVAVRGAQAVGNALNPQTVPTNAGGARPGPVAPQPPTPPVARPAPGAVQPTPGPQPTPSGPAMAAQTQTAVPPTPPRPQPQAGAPPPPVQPPAVVAQAANAAPPPGVMTPVQPAGNAAVAGFNALPLKTREAAIRALKTSGMDKTQVADAIRSLNDLPAGQNTNYEFELLRRYGAQFPDLEANLGAMGRKWANDTPKPRQLFDLTRDQSRQIMNDEVRAQIDSEGKYISDVARQNFGEGAASARETLDQLRNETSGEYKRILNPRSPYGPNINRMSPTNRQALITQVDAARAKLGDYLKRPEVMDNVPEWVRQKVLLELSNDLRGMKFPENERALMAQGELANIFTPDGELVYSPATWRALVDLYPTQVAHSVQSGFAKAAREARISTDPEMKTWAKILDRRRGKSAVRSNAANPDNRGFGLLHLLEQAAPGYKETRLKYGNIMGAEGPVEMAQDFLRFANDETALKEFADVLDELTPLQRSAVENQITTQVETALANKIDSPKPWQINDPDRAMTPNLTQLSKQPFLEALPRLFGEKGANLAEAIRTARSRTDNLTGIHPKYNSRTGVNTEDVKNAADIYENPAGKDVNVFDKSAQTVGGLGIGTAFIGVPGAPVAAGAMLGYAGAKALYNMWKRGKRLTNAEKSALTEWLFKSRRAGEGAAPPPPPGTPVPPQLPPRGPNGLLTYAGNTAVGATVGGAAGYVGSGGDPNATVKGALAGGGLGAVRGALKVRRNANALIDAVKPPKALSAPPSPPVKGPVNKAGFFGSGSKPLDMSEAGRMQRAREQGYTIEAYHGTRRDFDEFDVNEAGSNFSQDEGTIHFTDDAKDADRYAMSDTTGMPAEGGSTYPVLLRMKKPLVADRAFFEREGMGNVYANEDRISAWDTYHPFLKERAEEMGADGIILKDSFGKSHYVVFDPKNVRSKFATFDPSQSGSSKLLAGMGGSEGAGAVGGGALGYATAPDQNGDGVIDANERALGAIGGAVSGGLIVKGAKLGVNALKGGAKAAERVPEQSGFFGGKGPPKPANDAKPLKGNQKAWLGREMSDEDATSLMLAKQSGMKDAELAKAMKISVEDVPLAIERAREVTTLINPKKVRTLRQQGVADEEIARQIGWSAEETDPASLRSALDALERKAIKAEPPSQAGFFSGGKGTRTIGGLSKLTDRVTEGYGKLKQGALPNDPRHLNPAAEALQAMDPKAQLLVKRNAEQLAPKSAMEAAETPQGLSRLVGRLVSQDGSNVAPKIGNIKRDVALSQRSPVKRSKLTDKPIDKAVKAHQTRLAEDLMAGQRKEPDLINRDPAAGPKGALEKQMMSSYDWSPAREAQQEAILSDIMAEGKRGVGGIPERAGALDRFREGVAMGAEDPPLALSPRDENAVSDLLFDPAKAKAAAELLDKPVKPWVSDAEKIAIQIGLPAAGVGGLVGAGALIANQPKGDAEDKRSTKSAPRNVGNLTDDILEQLGRGLKGPNKEGMKRRHEEALKEADRQEFNTPKRSIGKIYTVPDRMIGTSNPAEPPPELNGLNVDTRIRAQQRLMALGYAPVKLKNGARFDDGIDGPQLREAVMAFQRENDLPVTGDLDPMTLRKMWGGKNFGQLPVMRNYGEEQATAPN